MGNEASPLLRPFLDDVRPGESALWAQSCDGRYCLGWEIDVSLVDGSCYELPDSESLATA
jgi:hypothetical protein